jgi:hypothetical protein
VASLINKAWPSSPKVVESYDWHHWTEPMVKLVQYQCSWMWLWVALAWNFILCHNKPNLVFSGLECKIWCWWELYSTDRTSEQLPICNIRHVKKIQLRSSRRPPPPPYPWCKTLAVLPLLFLQVYGDRDSGYKRNVGCVSALLFNETRSCYIRDPSVSRQYFPFHVRPPLKPRSQFWPL